MHAKLPRLIRLLTNTICTLILIVDFVIQHNFTLWIVVITFILLMAGRFVAYSLEKRHSH